MDSENPKDAIKNIGTSELMDFAGGGLFRGVSSVLSKPLKKLEKAAEADTAVDRLFKNATDIDQAAKGVYYEGAGDNFTQGSKIPNEVLKSKPLYSPDANKWLENGGKITIDNEVWKYTDSKGISVTYKNGYPDFKGSGHVGQEVDIGPFRNRSADFRLADKMAPNGPISPDSTWHHHENGRTLQEVDKNIHRNFTHRGGISEMKKK